LIFVNFAGIIWPDILVREIRCNAAGFHEKKVRVSTTGGWVLSAGK